jgi:hypothetical protein
MILTFVIYCNNDSFKIHITAGNKIHLRQYSLKNMMYLNLYPSLIDQKVIK